MWQDREKWHAQKGAELRKAEEGFLRSKKDLERQLSKLKGVGSGSASQKEEALEEEIKRCYVSPPDTKKPLAHSFRNSV
jgi:hypothetical protein